MGTRNTLDFTRRRFIDLMMSLSLSSWLIPSGLIFISGCKEGQKSDISGGGSDTYKFFDAYQGKVVEELTSLIIPSNDSPGAREAGIVFELDRIASNRPNLKKLYSFGIQWMDYMAKDLYGKDKFLDLPTDEMMQILDMADPYKSEQYKSIKNIQTLRNFFGTLIQQTKYVFYTSETGWQAVGYHGPPQWAGNPDYDSCSLE